VDSDAGDLTLRCTSDATGVPVAGDVVVTFGE
jgi:hypothetical protein